MVQIWSRYAQMFEMWCVPPPRRSTYEKFFDGAWKEFEDYSIPGFEDYSIPGYSLRNMAEAPPPPPPGGQRTRSSSTERGRSAARFALVRERDLY